MTGPAAPRSSPRTSISLGSAGRWLAPVLSIVGLLVVGLVTLNLLQGGVPFSSSNGKGNGNGNVGPDQTPAPSNVVIVPPEVVTLKGSIVYAKAGNIWVQTGKDAKQLTKGGDDSMRLRTDHTERDAGHRRRQRRPRPGAEREGQHQRPHVARLDP